MGSAAEGHYLHRGGHDLLERGCAVYNSDVDNDAFSCRTDHVTVKASNVRRVTFSSTMAQNQNSMLSADDVRSLIQNILEPLADADAWKQQMLLKCLEGCLIADRVMTDTMASNHVHHLYLLFIEESAIPADLDSWIGDLRSRNVSIVSLRRVLDSMERQVTNDNATIDAVLSGLTGSTVDHENDQSAADGIQALAALDAPAAADGIQAPNQQDAGRLQVQRSAAFLNLRDLGHGEEGDESTPSDGDYGSSTVGYHLSRGSGGTNPNGDA